MIVVKIAKRMVQLTVAKTFDRWAENTAKKKEQRRMIGSILKRWQRLELSSMLEKWIVMTDDRILCRKVMNKIIKRYLLVAQSRAFISWRSFVDNDRTADAEEARLEAIARKVAKRMIMLTTARTFDRWSVNIAEAKAQRHKVVTVVRRWQRGALYAVMNRWCAIVDERVMCRRVMQKLLQRHHHGALARALVSWCSYIRDLAAGEERQRANDRIESIQRDFSEAQNKAVAATVSLDESTKTQHGLRRELTEMRQSVNRGEAEVEELKQALTTSVEARRVEEERSTTLASEIHDLQEQLLGMTETAHEAIVEAQTTTETFIVERIQARMDTCMHARLARFVANMLRKTLLTAFVAWDEGAECLRNQVRKDQIVHARLVRFVANMRRKMLSTTFVAWDQAVSAACHDFQLEILQSRERENQELAQLSETRMVEAQASVALGLGRSIILRWAEGMHGLQQDALRKAFTTWQAGTDEMLKQEQRAGRALRWWRRHGIAKAFASWVDLVEVRRRCRRVLERMTRQGDMGVTARAFHRLRVFISEQDKATLRSELIELKFCCEVECNVLRQHLQANAHLTYVQEVAMRRELDDLALELSIMQVRLDESHHARERIGVQLLMDVENQSTVEQLAQVSVFEPLK